MDPGMLATVGHGTLSQEALGTLLRDAGLAQVVDVRRFPGSRAHPHVAREALEDWLPSYGLRYRWEPRLGGRRHLSREETAESPDPWWTVAAFRAYAGWTRSGTFREALDELLDEAALRPTVVLCSESVWWRCHRRLIADVVTLGHGMEVRHLMHDGKLRPHRVADGARVLRPGLLVWDDQASEGGQAPVM